MPRYNRGPTISRALTDEERELDDRTSSFLGSAPTANPGGYTSLGSRYHWMEQDLKMRAMQTAQLAAESQMATDQGDKRSLDTQFSKENEEEASARRGLDHVHQLVSSGMDYNDAVFQTARDHDLGLNETFARAADRQGKLYESPEDRENRIKKRELESLDLDKKTFDTEMALDLYRQNPELRGAVIKAKADQLRSEGITAANSETAARLQGLQDRIALDKLETTQNEWKRLGGIAGESLDALADLTHSFNKSGLGGVTHPDRVVKAFEKSPAVLGMLANEDFLKDTLKGPEAAAAFSKALNTLTEDGDINPADRQQAMSLVLSAAGEHKARYASAANDKLRADTLQKLGGGFEKEVSEILGMKDGSKSIPFAQASPLLTSSAYSTIKGAIAALPQSSASSLKDAYEARIAAAVGNDASGKAPTVQEAAARIRNIMADFAMEVSAAPKASSPAKTASSTPSGRKAMTLEAAAEFKKQAGGDMVKAKQLAIEAGY